MKFLIIIMLICHSLYAAVDVKIGILAFRSKAETVQEWSDTIAYLNQVNTKYHFVAIPLNYPEINEAVRKETIDFIITNSGHYVELEQKYRISRVASMLKYQDGEWQDHFGGVVFTSADRQDINTLQDLKGKKIAAVDSESLGGYAAQMYELHKQDIDKENIDFSFLGMPHSQALHAVLEKKADVGFVRTDVIEKMVRQGKLNLSKIKILNRQKQTEFPYLLSTALYPEWPIAKLQHTDKVLTNEVVVALLNRLAHSNPVEGQISWTAPLEYHDIHEVFMALRLPPYDKVQHFEWRDIHQKYKSFIWIIIVLSFMILIGIIIEVILRFKLKTETTKLKTFLKLSADGIYIIDINGNIILSSDKFSSMLGYTPQEMKGMNVITWDLLFPLSTILTNMTKFEFGENELIRSRHCRKDGSEYDAEINLSAIRIGRETWIYCSARDITQELAQKLHNQQAAMVFETSSDAILITDAQGVIISTNPAMNKLVGYNEKEMIGKDSRLLKSGVHDLIFYRQMWASLHASGHWEGEIIDQNKAGELFQKWLFIRAIVDDEGHINQYVAIFSDITDQKEAKQKIWYQANFDQLTGLSNRNMFMFRMEKHLQSLSRNPIPMALLFIDLDHFKEINDTLGHEKGDVLLREAANRIVRSVRQNDIVSRFGGDEFTVLLMAIHSPQEIQPIADALLMELSFPFIIDRIDYYVSASIGIALAPNDATTSEELLKHADQAMYEAKKLGRNQYQYFTSTMQDTVLKRSEMLRNLREAINNQHFMLYYQPILNLKTGKIKKAEALIRWKRPDGVMISPAEFIPLAEESGLITELGNWIFEEAVQQAVYWRKNYDSSFQISVNKSPVQFKSDKSKKSVLIEKMQRNNLDNNAIVVEITEGTLMESNVLVQQRLEEFGAFGVEVSLDDFGTGYSSLSYLKKFDIDYLKIDRSFIINIETDKNDQILAEAIVAMAHKLGIKVIAEGIETQAQRDFLDSIGCDFIQGYLIAKPLPASEFENLFLKSEGI